MDLAGDSFHYMYIQITGTEVIQLFILSSTEHPAHEYKDAVRSRHLISLFLQTPKTDFTRIGPLEKGVFTVIELFMP